MIDYIIPLISSYFSSGLAEYYLFVILALGFVAAVPNIVRYIIQWR